MSKTKLPIADYDTHWKEIIEGLFEDFIAFFLPEASPLIDFSRPVVFLEQELHKIIADSGKKGKKINDKLAKVYLKDGREQWILIHIEVQATPEATFPKRMFTYFYRIFDRYKQALTATAIYIGEGFPKSFGRFEYNFLGTKTVYEYNYYIVANAKEAELLASRNPFALAVLAMQYLHQTKTNGHQRFAFKRKLVELAMERHYSQHQIIKLFKFVWYILLLPKELEQKLQLEVIKVKTTDDMYVEKSRDWSNLLHMAVYGRTMDEFIAEQTLLAEQFRKTAEQETKLRQASIKEQNKLQKAIEQEAKLRQASIEEQNKLQKAIEQEAKLRQLAEQEQKQAIEQEAKLRQASIEEQNKLQKAIEQEAKLRQASIEEQNKLQKAIEQEAKLRQLAEQEQKQALENQIKLMLKLEKLSLEEIAVISNKTVEEITIIAKEMKEE